MYGNKRIICWAPVTHRPRISAGHLLHFTRCGVSARRLGELGAGVIIRRPTHSKGQNHLKICLPTALSQKPVHTATGRVIGRPSHSRYGAAAGCGLRTSPELRIEMGVSSLHVAWGPHAFVVGRKRDRDRKREKQAFL